MSKLKRLLLSMLIVYIVITWDFEQSVDDVSLDGNSGSNINNEGHQEIILL